MNLSLRNRVTTSFIIANLIVLILTFVVFHFLNSLNKEIENITVKSNRVSLLNDEIRISAVSILKYQRRILTHGAPQELVDKLIILCDTFSSQLQTLDSLYRDADVKKVVAQMNSYVDSLKLVLSKAAFYNRGETAGVASIGELADKILDSYSDFQDIQYFQTAERDKKIKKIINETKRNMMITLIIGFLDTIVLGLVIPNKIALPFKKIKDAIRELQDCNFDVSIYYNQEDEIGEIAREMNKMISSFKVFDDLRADRIQLEQRKFDALANLVKKPVLVANADNKLIYMNNKTYTLFKLRSEDVIGKVMEETLMPHPVLEAFGLAIKRRSKIENHEITVTLKHKEAITVNDEEDSDDEDKNVAESSKEGENGVEEELVFQGHANIIPIRGKESSRDYYLMVLSTEVFT